MGTDAQTVRCPICRAQVLVEERDTHGDQIHCDNCHTAFKVVRQEDRVRLVVSDIGPFRDQLREVQQRIKTLETEAAAARASLGIGVNGGLLGLLYVVVKIAWEDSALSQGIIITAVLISLVCGILLELVNLLFLAKRQNMTRLSGEIAEAKRQARQLKQTIRSAQRG